MARMVVLWVGAAGVLLLLLLGVGRRIAAVSAGGAFCQA
jgi:hypothetical protein